MAEIVERGPWSVREEEDSCGFLTVWIISDDFTHDVWLKLSGDFGDNDEKRAYAEEIARRLNTPN